MSLGRAAISGDWLSASDSGAVWLRRGGRRRWSLGRGELIRTDAAGRHDSPFSRRHAAWLAVAIAMVSGDAAPVDQGADLGGGVRVGTVEDRVELA